MSPRVAVALRRGPQLRRRVHLARGRGDGRRATSSTPDAITPNVDLRRADRGDRVEPDHLVLRPAVELVARADRRRRRRARSPPPAPTPILGDGIIGKVLIPAVIAPVLAFVVGAIAIVVCYRIVGRQRPGPVTRGFRLGQVVSGGMLALAHGTNDAQKTMGVIALALIANGDSRRGRRSADMGDRLAPPPRSRSAPTPAAGGSSGRWARGSSRWTPPRGSRRRAPAPR